MDYLERITAAQWHDDNEPPDPFHAIYAAEKAKTPEQLRQERVQDREIREAREAREQTTQIGSEPSSMGKMMAVGILQSLASPSRKEAPRRQPDPQPQYGGGTVHSGSGSGGAMMAALLTVAVVVGVSLAFWAYHQHKMNKLRAVQN